MNFKKNLNILIPFVFIFITKVSSQTLSPYTLNMGGGYSESFILEWSIGESASIDNFLNINNGLNTGVLQPKSRIRKLTNPIGPDVFGSQIMIYPNLTSNMVYFKGSFITLGNLEIQLIQNNSTLITILNAGKVFGKYQKSFSLEKYSDGLFYFKVYFKPEFSPVKIGIYKVIKATK